jgi:hypothetical protein
MQLFCNPIRKCGLVVRVPGYRSRGSGSNLGSTTFSEKLWVWNRVKSASRVQLRRFLNEKAAPVKKAENTAVGICHADHVGPFIRKSLHQLRRQTAVAHGLRPRSFFYEKPEEGAKLVRVCHTFKTQNVLLGRRCVRVHKYPVHYTSRRY